MEIIPAFGGFLILVKKHFTVREEKTPLRYPEITLIIPVYNSESTLEECLASIQASDYPKELIHIMLVNNQSADNSFGVFCSCQLKYPELSMQWLKARQGKSKALNLALFNSQGKYIIHIDSDGKLNPKAIKNMVERFEAKPKIDCLTGVILTDPKMIEETKSFPMRLLRRCEFLEYCQAFLAGRNFESELNSIYTLSGAFSAFRKSTILKTQLYNTDTVCEDTHVTFQVRRHMKKNILLCENAFFFVDPIESLEKLYTQRQRWQTGELEVSHMFLQDGLKSKGFFSDFMVRQLTYDHTFAFPRMIWYFALICLMFLNYPLSLIAGSVVFLYLLYVFSAFLFYLNIISYLKGYRELRRYYVRKWYILPLMPFYNFLEFWIRFAAIINSIRSRNGWKASTMSEEKQRFTFVIQNDFRLVSKAILKMKSIVNND
jgi:putative glycosyltransferase (exosortase G-associated)